MVLSCGSEDKIRRRQTAFGFQNEKKFNFGKTCKN